MKEDGARDFFLTLLRTFRIALQVLERADSASWREDMGVVGRRGPRVLSSDLHLMEGDV